MRDSFKECFSHLQMFDGNVKLKIVDNEPVVQSDFKISDSPKITAPVIEITPESLDYIVNLSISDTIKKTTTKIWWIITAINVAVGLWSSTLGLLIHYNVI